jgi:hypothetical protein
MAKLTSLDRALDRQAIITRAFQIKTSPGKNKTAALAELSQTHNIHLSTLYRLMSLYQDGGLDALVIKRPRKQWFPKSIEPAVINYVRQLITADPTRTGANLIEAVEIAAREYNWKVGSRSSFYRLFTRLRSELGIIPIPSHSADRDKVHQMVDHIPSEQLPKLEAYIEYLLTKPARSTAVIKKPDSNPSVEQLSLDL